MKHSFREYWTSEFRPDSIYYQVDHYKTHSKVDALIRAQGDFSKIKYYFMEGVWDCVDWTKEPEHDFWEIMSWHCRYLRENYSHLTLWYSGGYDSQTIMDCFIKNNLHIDEILIYGRDYFENWVAQNEPKEALQIVLELKRNIWPNLKITEVNWKKDDLLRFYKSHGDQWILKPGHGTYFTKNDRSFLYNHNDDLKKILEHQSRVDIEGREKPRLTIEDGKWMVSSLDSTNDPMMNSRSLQFYNSSKFPELHVKQTWLMINWIESLPFQTIGEIEKFLHSLQSHQEGPEIYKDWNLAIGRSLVKTTSGYITTIQGPKMWYKGDVTNIIESRNLLKYIGSTHPEILKIYLDGITNLKIMCPTLFNKDGSLVPCWGKKYYIKNVEPAKNLRKIARKSAVDQ